MARQYRAGLKRAEEETEKMMRDVEGVKKASDQVQNVLRSGKQMAARRGEREEVIREKGGQAANAEKDNEAEKIPGNIEPGKESHGSKRWPKNETREEVRESEEEGKRGKSEERETKSEEFATSFVVDLSHLTSFSGRWRGRPGRGLRSRTPRRTGWRTWREKPAKIIQKVN